MPSKLERAFQRGLKPGGDLAKEIDKLEGYEVSSRDDALAICQALEQLEPYSDDSPLHAVVGLFQDVSGIDSEAFQVLREHGVPILVRLVDQLRDNPEASDDLMFVLKILAMYGTEEGATKVIEAARAGFNDDGYMWSVILGRFTAGHPQSRRVMEALSNPLPANFIGMALLDVANQIALGSEEPFPHPFDSPEGKQRLFGWLRDPDSENFSYAHSATASLPFLSNPERDQLLALAMDHPDSTVQMEGAWASAKLGSRAGLKFLSRFCLDPNYSTTACNYLRELGKQDEIPAQANEPDFQAMAEMCSWLAHPQEFGRPPDSIELADSREIFWPPTDDHRWVWLFKYRYEPHNTDDGEEPELNEGYGMVGSTTFALFGEATADLSPEDVYALHCCWELEMNDDNRAPTERTVEADRKLLAAENDGF